MEPQPSSTAQFEAELGDGLESEGSTSASSHSRNDDALRKEFEALKETFCREIQQMRTEMRTLLSPSALEPTPTTKAHRTASRVQIVEPVNKSHTFHPGNFLSPEASLRHRPPSTVPLSDDSVIPRMGEITLTGTPEHDSSHSAMLSSSGMADPPLALPPTNEAVTRRSSAMPKRVSVRRFGPRPTIDEVVVAGSPTEKAVSEMSSSQAPLGQLFDILSQSSADPRGGDRGAAQAEVLRQLASTMASSVGGSTTFRNPLAPLDAFHVRRSRHLSVAPPRSVTTDSVVDEEDDDALDDSRRPTQQPTDTTKPTHRPARTTRSSKALSVDHPVALALDVLFVLTAALTFIMSFFAVVNGVESHQGSFDTVQGCLIGSQLYYCVWVVSRFLVQHRRGDWEVVESIVDVRQHYLSWWFRFDFAVAFPIDFVFLGWEPRVFFWCQLLRQLLRFVRIESLRVSCNPLIPERRWITMLMLLAAIVMSCHSCAVIFMHLDDRSYMDGLYFAATTMTSVGYGDLVTGTSYSSRIFTIFVEFLGIAMVAAVTGFAASLFTSNDALKVAVEEKKLMLASMLDYYQVPWSVQAEIISMFPTVIEAENEARFKQMTADLPTFLVDKIEGYTRAKALSSAIPLFNQCETDVLLQVTKRLVHRFHQPNEAIIVAGDDGYEMYFLVRGVADVVITLPDGGHVVVATLRSGSFFGEMALVNENVKRTASVIAVSPSELLVLSKHNFDELSVEYESVKSVFNTVIEAARARAAAVKK